MGKAGICINFELGIKCFSIGHDLFKTHLFLAYALFEYFHKCLPYLNPQQLHVTHDLSHGTPVSPWHTSVSKLNYS